MKKIKSDYTVRIHPAKVSDPYHPDLEVISKNKVHIGEVKIKNSPLFFGQRYGVDPQFALTMDLKDSFNYLKYLDLGIDLIVFIWVKWEAHEMVTSSSTYSVKPMAGIFKTTFSKLRELEVSSEPPQIHWYKEQFRKPTIHCCNQENGWYTQLKRLDERLTLPNGKIMNVTSKGYTVQNNIYYPAGHSSGSYVFDLSNEKVFERVFLDVNS